MLELDLTPKASELWAAASLPLGLFGVSPARLSRTMSFKTTSDEPVTEKRWTGQLTMFRFEIVEFAVIFLTVMKVFGLRSSVS